MARLELTSAATSPRDAEAASLVGRLWRPGIGPCVVRVRAERLEDVTAAFPTVRDLCELDDPAAALAAAEGEDCGSLDSVLATSTADTAKDGAPRLLAPIASRR